MISNLSINVSVIPRLPYTYKLICTMYSSLKLENETIDRVNSPEYSKKLICDAKFL